MTRPGRVSIIAALEGTAMLLQGRLLRRTRQAFRIRRQRDSAYGRLLVQAGGTLAFVLAGGGAFAQSASQITPPTFRSAPPQAGGSIVFSGRPGLDTPPGAEQLTIRIVGVAIDGPLPELAAEHRALEARLVGKRIPAAEIFAAVRDLEAAYARAGYVLVRVVLPAQTLRDGERLRLVVVDGFIERVEMKDVPELVRERIGALIAPLVGRRSVRLREIERRLLLAGDTPGVALRSTLTPGSGTGATVLMVEGRHRLVTGFVGADNTLTSALGRSQASAGLDVNGALRMGETFYARAAGHVSGDDPSGFGDLFSHRPRVRTLSAGAVIPLGLDGLTFNIEGTESRTTPKATTLVQTASIFERLSLRLRYPFIRSRPLNVGSELIFDAATEDFSLLTPGLKLPLSSDRLRVLRIAGDMSYQLEGNGLLAARAIASFGVDGLGARSAADATPLNPLSRAGADADFQKFETVLTYTQPIAEYLAFAAYARGQTSFNQALVRSEQIGIASFNELSTFDSGTLGGDSGWILRGEVSSPWTVSGYGLPFTATPYAFAATGALYLQRPTVVEQDTTRVSSLGVGLRLGTVFDPGFSDAFLAFEIGRRFRDDDQPNANRFTFVGSIRF